METFDEYMRDYVRRKSLGKERFVKISDLHNILTEGVWSVDKDEAIDWIKRYYSEIGQVLAISKQGGNEIAYTLFTNPALGMVLVIREAIRQKFSRFDWGIDQDTDVWFQDIRPKIREPWE